ncbi:MAG: hypothetical protein GY839_09290, partial [candidate division Zixibacteria bacterium]|nr:hypothetical protein [candidate division Zixibacteria bacterium]
MRKTAIVFISLMLVIIPLVVAKAEVSDEVLKIQQMIEANGLKWTAGQTSMMDLSPEERQMRLGLEIPDDVRARFEALNDSPPPVLLSTQDYFSWDEFGCVSVVDDQRSCGSCWAFAATHAFESAYIIAEGVVPDFSEQQALVCNFSGSDCGGGWMADAYHVFMGYGAVEESCMPYCANDDYPCTQGECTPVAYLEGCEDVPNNVNAIKNALMLSPLSTTFTVYDDFNSYSNGCYEHADVEPLNHAVVIIGWDDNMCDGEGAWIVKNSWGTNFGWDGFFFMKYGSAGFGQHTQRPVYGTAGMPDFSFSPEQIEIEVPSGQQAVVNLEFVNDGNGLLRYNLTPAQPEGQDEYGYYCADSDDQEGPAYDWVDITEIGEVIEFPYNIDDGNSGWLDFGFDFTYYGTEYHRAKACTNGW